MKEAVVKLQGKKQDIVTGIALVHIYYSFDTGEYHESVGLVFTRVPQARA